MRVVIFTIILLQSQSKVSANTEKAIFLAPRKPASIATDLSNLCLAQLSPSQPLHHTDLVVPAVTNKPPAERQGDSWFILHQLNIGQRYEARVCWAATVRADIRVKS